MARELISKHDLELRPLEARDAEPIAELWADAEVMRFMVGARDPHQIRDAFRRLAIAGEEAEERWWVLRRKGDGTFLGQCGLCPKEVDGILETELVYLVPRAYWGQGFGTQMARAVANYAENDLEIEKLIALIQHGNAASEVVAQRVGFQRVRDLKRPDGRVLSVFVRTR